MDGKIDSALDEMLSGEIDTKKIDSDDRKNNDEDIGTDDTEESESSADESVK